MAAAPVTHSRFAFTIFIEDLVLGKGNFFLHSPNLVRRVLHRQTLNFLITGKDLVAVTHA